MNANHQIFRTPQLFIQGKISSAHGFYQASSLYLKFQVLTGPAWKLLAGISQNQTFQSLVQQGFAIFQHPLDLHYTAESLRGWPRIYLEVWMIDEDGRNKLAGYGTACLPLAPGSRNIQVPCWIPKSSWTEVSGNHQLQNSMIMISSMNKFGLNTDSTGSVILQLSTIHKDFHLHGVRFT